MVNILENQREFFNTNKSKEVNFRIQQLKKLKNILKDNEELLYKAIYNDFGKSEFETYISELALIYHEINNFIKKAYILLFIAIYFFLNSQIFLNPAALELGVKSNFEMWDKY